jgi:RNA 3'-phosphate cyclase
LRSVREHRVIDGAYGEGGGQLLRSAVALSALTGTSVRIQSIRARREPPGLAPQHLAAVRAVAEICDARCAGATLRSTDIAFVPGPLRCGSFAFDVGTAGSGVLVLQALLPLLVSAPGPSRVTITGGTDVRGAPSVDYLTHVLLPLLATMGARVAAVVARRGYYPRGGGIIDVQVAPAPLRPLQLRGTGPLRTISGLAHVAHLPESIAGRMRNAALAELGRLSQSATCATAVLGEDAAIGRGGAIALWAEHEHTVLGTSRVAERGVPAESLGAAAGRELAADLACGGTLDIHAADQVLVYCALARGESTFTARALSTHAQTAMWLIEQLLPVTFTVSTEVAGSCVRVACRSTA